MSPVDSRWLAVLVDLTDWGVHLITPEGQEDLGFAFGAACYWHIPGIDDADSHPTEVVRNRGEAGAITTQVLADHPSIGQLPAVQSGRVVEWLVRAVWSYRQFAALIAPITETLAASD